MDPQLKSQSSSGISHGCTCYFYFPRHLGLPNWPFRPLAHIFLGNYKVFQSYVGKGGYTGGNPTLDSPKTIPSLRNYFFYWCIPLAAKGGQKIRFAQQLTKSSFFPLWSPEEKNTLSLFPPNGIFLQTLKGSKITSPQPLANLAIHPSQLLFLAHICL